MDVILLDEVSDKDTLDIDFFSNLYKNQSFNLSFVYSSDFQNTHFLRNYIKLILEIVWFDNIWINRFILIADEMNNNAIEYGSNSGDLNKMNLVINKQENWFSINLEIIDSWNWTMHKTALEMEELRNNKVQKWFDNHNSIRWRGLFLIITKLVDELYFKDDENGWLVVWINKNIVLS